jgi:hypothetical protein
MDSQVIQAPTPEEVTSHLGESKRRNACLSLYTHCAVAYEGRDLARVEASFIEEQGEYLRLQPQDESDNSESIYVGITTLRFGN